MKKGQYSNTIGAIKLLNEMLRLGADQHNLSYVMKKLPGITRDRQGLTKIYLTSSPQYMGWGNWRLT